MSLIICGVCHKVKHVQGTSGGTEPLYEAMTVREWCSCPRATDYWPYTFPPPVLVDQRDAELARLRAELEQARVQLAGCLCAAEGTGDADKVKQGDYAWTPALQRTVELRAALEKAHAQTKDIKADVVELGTDINEMIAEKGRLRAALASAERERDEARRERDDKQKAIVTIVTGLEMTSKQLEQARRERDEARSLSIGWRRSATYYKGGFMAMGSAWYEDTMKRAEEAERGQAGKE